MILPVFAMLLGIQDAAPAPPEGLCPSLPAGTPLKIEVLQPVNSRTARSNDLFPIALAEPLVVDGETLIPEGTPGVGQVTWASHPKPFKANEGELVVVARYLELGGKYLPLRGFRIIAQTQTILDRRILTFGSNVDVPAGSVATAKVAGECAATVPAPPPLIK